MGKKLNLSHLTEAECEQILEVLQKDFEVQKAAKKRVSTAHEELLKEHQRVDLLKSNPKFNDTSCIICLSRFGLFTHRRRKCSKCFLNVCSPCVAQYEDPSGKTKDAMYICNVCSKDKAYRLLTNQWFGAGKSNSKNFGSSKIARSLFKKASSSLSDTELDSGYQPSSLRSLPGTGHRPRLDQVFDIDISGTGRDSPGAGGEDGAETDRSFLTVHEERGEGSGDDSDSSFDDEVSPRSVTSSFAAAAAPVPRPIQKATSLDKLFFASKDAAFSLPPRPVPGESTPLSGRSRQNSVSGSGEFPQHHNLSLSANNRFGSTSGLATPTGSQTPTLEHSYERRTPTSDFTKSLGRSRPSTLEFFRPGSRRGGDTSGLYKEALDGARRSEEFKFRVKFDQLLVDLHLAVDEKSPNGLSNSFASPSYGEVMLLFRDRVRELLKGFSKRLSLAYDSFSNIDDVELTLQNVKGDISHFVEDLIGESLELTPDEAGSDLSDLSSDSPHADQSLFEELLAQAIISKLLENHRREVSQSLNKSEGGNAEDKLSESVGSKGTSNITISISSSGSGGGGGRRYISNNNSSRNSQDYVDGELTGSNRYHRARRHRKDSIESLFSNKSELIPDYDDDDDDEDDDAYKDADKNDTADNTLVGNSRIDLDGIGDEVADDDNNHGDGNSKRDIEQSIEVIKEFEELRELVKNSQGRPKIEAQIIEEIIEEEEVEEEQISQVTVDRSEANKEVDSRFSVLDKVFNSEQALPDFSQFENIDFNSDEVDPDLLSMNLAIIPEETEEELEQEDEEESEGDGREGRGWRGNWIFKGKDGAPMPSKKKRLTLAKTDHPFMMMVPDPDHSVNARVGNKDADELSDFSDSDLFASDEDVSDEDESSFYPNTSKELSRIRKHRNRQRGGKKGKKSSMFKGDVSDETGDNEDGDGKKGSLDEGDDIPDVPGPIIEVPKQELKLLTDLVPAENDDPRFVLLPESVTVMEGEPVKFTCSVEGTPPIDVFWYREGAEVEELDDSEDVELSSDGDKHTAVLYNMGHSMAGQYMCIALSEAGKAIQYLVVSVKDNKQELKAPEFLKSIDDVEVTEGQSVKFRVKVKGFPPPRINWYKDGTLLRSSRGCRIEKFGNRDYILTIDYATMDDDAEYTVMARNVAGEIRSTAQVLVEPQSDMPARKQKHLSDSDSDNKNKTSINNNNTFTSAFSSASSLFASPPPPPSAAAAATSSSPSLRSRQEAQQVNQLDRRMDMTQKAIDVEASKMEKDAAKLSNINCSLDGLDERLASLESSLPSFASFSSEWSLNNSILLDDDGGKGQSLGVDSPRLMSNIDLELLHTAEEVMKKEKSDAASNKSKDKTIDDTKLNNNQNAGVVDLDLPDSLDKHPPLPPRSSYPRTKHNDDDVFARMSRKKRAPEKFTSEVSIAKFSTSLTLTDPDVNPTTMSAAVDEILSQTSMDHRLESAAPVAATSNDDEHEQNDVSFDSGKDLSVLDNSVSSVSSGGGGAGGASGAMAEQNMDEALLDPVKRHEQFKEFHARDFEIHPNKKWEKKKWSVNLQPFSPKAEIVNKSLDEDDEKVSMLGIQIPTDFSPDSSQHSSRGDDNDNSSQSSPRQSVDSGVYVTRRQREEKPEPVRMFGHTSEADVPESRTEFNTDEGSFDVPSVNRLKAMFGGSSSSPSSSTSSSPSSSRLSSLSKPGDSNVVQGSISARNVSRGRLDKPWAEDTTTASYSSTVNAAAATTTLASPPAPSPSSSSSTSSLHISSSSSSSSSADSIQASRSSVVLQLSPSPSSSSSSLIASPLSPPSKTAEVDNNISNNNDNGDNYNDNDNNNNNSNSSSNDNTDNSYWARKQRQRDAKSKQNRNSLPPDMYFDFNLGKEPIQIYPDPNPAPKILSPPAEVAEDEKQRPFEPFEPLQQQIVTQQQQTPVSLMTQLQQKVDNNDEVESMTTNREEALQQSFEDLQDFDKSPSPRSKMTTTTVQPVATPRSSQQPKLVVKQATIEDGTSDMSGGAIGGGASVPRIKSGCISARAAFWEKRMTEGPSDVDSDDFPEMVERADVSSEDLE